MVRSYAATAAGTPCSLRLRLRSARARKTARQSQVLQAVVFKTASLISLAINFQRNRTGGVESYLANGVGGVRGKREGAGFPQFAAAQAAVRYSRTSLGCWRKVVTAVKLRSTT